MFKKINRCLIYPIAYRAGIPNILIRRGNKNLILCYHGVCESPNFGINNRHMNLIQFERNLKFLNENFEIVSLTKIFNDPYHQSEKPLLALTFDDGYVNNFINVLQLAEKYKIPVAFFIICGALNDPEFITWYDAFDFVKFGQPAEIEFDSLTFNLQNGIYQNRNETLDNHIKMMGRERVNAMKVFNDRYEKNIEVNKKKYPEYWKLASKELLESNAENPWLTIGSHSQFHYNLGNISLELAEEELTNSKRVLQEIIGKEITSIAYPDGSYNEEVKLLAIKAGYKYQLAIDYQLDSDSADRTLRNRISISNSTTHEANMLRLGLEIKKSGF